MTPLMPVIFIVSAVVSGIALCMLTYIVMMEIRKLRAGRRGNGRLDQSERVRRSPPSRLPSSLPLGTCWPSWSWRSVSSCSTSSSGVHGSEVLGRATDVIYGKEAKQFSSAVWHREPGAPRPVSAPPERASGSGGPASGPVRRLHDALERRDRRPGVFPFVRGLHALRFADSPHGVETFKEGLVAPSWFWCSRSCSSIFYAKFFPVFAPTETG